MPWFYYIIPVVFSVEFVITVVCIVELEMRKPYWWKMGNSDERPSNL